MAGKETVVDDRLMHLFSIIAGQVRNKQELFTKESTIMDTLLNQGFHVMEADTALMLMQSLVKRQTEQAFEEAPLPSSPGMRMMNVEERSRFTPEAFGFVTRLAQLGLISADERDMLIEKSLASSTERIDLGKIQDLTLLFLFTEDDGEEDGLKDIQRKVRRTAWN